MYDIRHITTPPDVYSSILVRMFWPPLLLDLLLLLLCRYSLLRAFQKTQRETACCDPVGCAPRCIAGRGAAAAAQQQQQRPAPLRSLGLAVVVCLRCRVCAISVCVHPGCPSLPWLRDFGLGIKLGACRPIAWTAGARMNLEQSSVQIVHSSGKFRAFFFVKFVQFSSFGWIS